MYKRNIQRNEERINKEAEFWYWYFKHGQADSMDKSQ